MRYRHVPQAAAAPALSVVVLLHEVNINTHRLVVGLASMAHQLPLIFVCLDPQLPEYVATAVRRQPHMIEHYKVFKASKQLSVVDGMNAGMQSVRTPHFCVLHSDCLIHSQFPNWFATLDAHPRLTYMARQMTVDVNGWSTFSEKFKPVWSVQALVQARGFQCDAQSIREIECEALDRIGTDVVRWSESVLFWGCA